MRADRLNVTTHGRDCRAVASFNLRNRRLCDGKATCEFDLGEIVEPAQFWERNARVFCEVFEVRNCLRLSRNG